MSLVIVVGIAAFFVFAIVKGGTDPRTPRPAPARASRPITLFGSSPAANQEDDHVN